MHVAEAAVVLLLRVVTHGPWYVFLHVPPPEGSGLHAHPRESAAACTRQFLWPAEAAAAGGPEHQPDQQSSSPRAVMLLWHCMDCLEAEQQQQAGDRSYSAVAGLLHHGALPGPWATRGDT